MVINIRHDARISLRKHSCPDERRFGGRLLWIALLLRVSECLQLPPYLTGPANGEHEGLMRWMRSQGAYISPKLRLQKFSGYGIGVGCIADIVPGEILVAVPKRLCFVQSPDGTRRREMDDYTAPMDEAATKLLHEAQCYMSDGSFFAPYLEVLLPTDLSLLPHMWGSQRIMAMNGSVLCEDAFLNRKEAMEDYATAQKAGLDCDQGVWMHIRSLVSSRAYVIDGRTALIPLFDMFNHQDASKNLIRRGDGVKHKRSEFVFEAKQYTKAGTQVFSTYGPLTPAQKFLTFGFYESTGPVSKLGVTAFRVGPNRWEDRSDVIDVELVVNVGDPDLEDMEEQLHDAAEKLSFEGRAQDFEHGHFIVLNKLKQRLRDLTANEYRITRDTSLPHEAKQVIKLENQATKLFFQVSENLYDDVRRYGS